VSAALPAGAGDQQELVRVLASSHYPGASPEAIRLVLAYCRAASLDPMQRPVHIVPMWDRASRTTRDVILPGIGLYRIQAARTGQLAGVSRPEWGPTVTAVLGGVEVTFPEWCRITVRRRLADGTVAEFTAEEWWVENYATAGRDTEAPNAMWRKRPRGQLRKCTEAQALRMAFPEVGQSPTAEEMEGRTIEQTELQAERQPPPAAEPSPQAAPQASQPPTEGRPAGLEPYPAERFEAQLPRWRELVASGRRTAAEIAAAIASRYALTVEQREAIEALEAIDDEQEEEGQ
jgi:phage recombination protein Bet